MNHLRNIGALLYFNFVIAFSAFSQFKFEKSILINKDDGLPVNAVRMVRKDDDGFMWFATSDGLCRFDGQQVKTFKEGKDLRHSLFDNSIHTVLPIKEHIWFGTNQGVSVLNKKDYTFKHYQLFENGKPDSLIRRFDQAVSVLFLDRSGDIWVGTRERGVYMYDKDKDDFRFFTFSREKYPPLKPSLGSDNSVLGIEASKTDDSIIWAGTTAGLWQINKYSGDVKLFTYPQKDKDYQVALNAFRRLYHHDDGMLYVGNWAAGINVFDPVTKTYTPLEAKDEIGQLIRKGNIGNIIRKNDHELWLSTTLGIAIYDTKLKAVTWHKFNNTADNEFYAVDFIDEANRVWYSDYTGLRYFDPAVQQFAQYSFKSMAKPGWGFAFYILPDDSGNDIVVCPRFTDGIYHFNKEKKTWKKSLFPASRRFLNDQETIRGIVRLSNGDYIISSDHGLYTYSEKKGTLNQLKDIPGISPSRRGDIILDRAGNLWISDDTVGLVRWNPLSGAYHVYKDEILMGDTNVFISRIMSGFFGRLNNFFEDSHGNIWFQRANGLGVYVLAKDSICNFIFSKNEKNSFPAINAFAEDKKGRVWASSGDGWLGYALAGKPQEGIVHKLNIRERGMDGFLRRLATDKNGEVWGYTSTDLVKINANDLSLTTYSFQYGVAEPDFSHFSFLPSGEMIFGGRNDITIADPSELKRNKETPVPYISALEVLNQPYNFRMNDSSLNLSYKQNFFSIEFSAKAYTMAKDVRFRYRLNGFDDWKEVTGQGVANYTNVPGDDYVFQLQAANNEGVWNENIYELPIHVATAFWLTWWFRIGGLLLVGLAAYWLYRYRVAQVKKKQRLKSEYEKKLANVEMSALLAQMNPHFLFNSLNSIDSYIIRNESKKASEYLNNFARLMRLILQNSRSNYINLKDELEALDLYMQMESLRFKNKFSYSIAVDENIETSSIVIPPMLIQPYVENAIWHGLMHKTNGTEGLVKINISKNTDDLLCVIEDNGIGRKKAAELKEQKQKNHKRSMGMQITQDRIEIINKLYNMNASINIYDMQDELGNAKGTKVELIIPV